VIATGVEASFVAVHHNEVHLWQPADHLFGEPPIAGPQRHAEPLGEGNIVRVICRQQSTLISDLQGPGMQLCIVVQLNR
jgi:hypothetical protein